MHEEVRGFSLGAKLTIAYSVLIVLVSLILALVLYWQLRSAQRLATRERLQDILIFAAPMVDGDFHALIRSPQDEEGPFYRTVSSRLKSIRVSSPAIHRIYTLRARPDKGFAYVVDIDPDRPAHVGRPYQQACPSLRGGPSPLSRPVVENEFNKDSSGVFLKGYAPIYDQFHKVDGVLVIEIDAAPVLEREAHSGWTALAVFLGAAPLSLLFVRQMARRLSAPVIDLVRGAKRASEGDLDQAVSVYSRDEIGLLAESFNAMTTQLRRTMQGLEHKVDELRQTENELRQAKDYTGHIVSAAPTLICGIAPDGTTISVNRAVCDSTGYAAGELIGNNWWRIFYPDREYAQVEQLFCDFEKGPVVNYEMRLTTKTGEKRIISWNSANRFDESGELVEVIGIGADITERKRAENEILKLNAELEGRVIERTAQFEAASKELADFSYTVSHDLRAPLRAIDGFSHALKEDYGDVLDAQAGDYLERVRLASQRMGELIDCMQNLAGISRSEMHLAPVDLSSLAGTIADELHAFVPERNVDFIIAQGLVVNADPDLMRIALANLLGNAWKFTGKHPAATIEVGMIEHEGIRAYFVRDDGAGFDMAYADKLFRPFYRMQPLKEFEGLGVGLATVQRIVHRHGGRIWAQGEIDKGATFYFTIES